MRSSFLWITVALFLLNTSIHAQEQGKSLLPVPQKVSLTDERYLIDDTWSVAGAKNHPALVSLTAELRDRFSIRLKSGGGSKNIQLVVRPGSVNIGQTTDTNRTSLLRQAYRLQLEKNHITITANADQGLFYGVQTLLQLVQTENGRSYFSGGEITDWPDMDLRMIYWDDAHHLERFEAIKRAIRQAAAYKINAFTLKLEGHFQFTSARPIVEPYAYTAAEFQELTDYAKARYVELIPYIDAPAHISFILKHPEYKSIRAFPNSNYDLNVIDPKADELMLGMIDELINANKGGKYFFLSTDEAYYVGKSEKDKSRAETLGGNGRLLAEYITRISNKIHEKGRKVIIWGEYPLLASDINYLPSHLINGINGNNKDYGTKFREHGIRHLVFTSVQGVEPMFPNYYRLPKKSNKTGSLALTDDELQQGENAKGRVNEVISAISSQIEAGKSDFMGVIVCGWADAGSNPETFWLGYATGTAAAWNVKSINAKDLTHRFYNSFYGAPAADMDKMYQLLSTQAEFWENSWEWQTSNYRTPIIGYSAAIFDKPRPAKDQVLPLLPVPSSTDLSLKTDWNDINKDRLVLAEKFLKENNELMQQIQNNLEAASYQQYHLQVLHSVAQLCRQNVQMLLDLKKINALLTLSSKTVSGNPSAALSLIDNALETVEKIRRDRNETLDEVTTIWYQDWLPRVAEANGRKYLDEVDDVKDHPPVRTVDMNYLIYRQLNYPLGEWAKDVIKARNQFAEKNNLPASNIIIDWQNVY